ncbi:MAG: DUF11 domain-containing protein [Calothrix sp. FI2-JRJ7]|jgi:uncharacterized repeat protein (TIGR01451 family)|nr:DUF11 domain-containing protein [Calothrix sp. FI2-JRJ7]
MTSILSWLRRKHLFFPVFTLSIFTYGIIPSSAQIEIPNTARVGADNIPEGVESNQVVVRAGQAALEIIKTGDRAAAEPGDTVIYRLAIRNTGRVAASNITVTDRLPLGLIFVPRSIRGSIGDRTVRVDPSSGNRGTVTLSTPEQLQPNQSLNISYAVEVTPDAVRGTGRNLAQARAGNQTSNQASHTLRVRAGIVSDCATLIGRVFVDKNFDGEQQRNEPGVPNAVIYMDDGNRIVTDANGLYSLANVVSGYRSAALDLTSLPGYALAPNNYFIERNSQSRMIRLAPGSMARVNFAVTPAFSEGKR